MSKFAKAMTASALTWNGALSYSTPDPSGKHSGRVSLFFKGVRGLNTPRLYEYLRESLQESIIDTFVLVFHLRDCRGGKGERELGRRALVWLMINRPVEFRKVLPLLSVYGRWDDLLQLFPGVLNLTNLDTVNQEFVSKVPSHDYLRNLQVLQQEAVQLVANQLEKDLKCMHEGKPVSLCAKWTPTEGDSLDKKHKVYITLAKALKCKSKDLRKTYNTPLREYLNVVERFMCSGDWGEIDFNKVPSQAMRKLKKAFEKHDQARFLEWREALQKPDYGVKVNAKQLHPHELVKEVRQKGGSCDAVCEAQWKVLIEETKKLGTLKDSVVVVDTSYSMTDNNCLPLDVSVAMGLLISDVVQGPFHGHCITFNTEPKFAQIPDSDLATRWRVVKNMEWGGSTDIQATFKLILNRGVECKLTDDDMPKRLFIISDMQFNQADKGGNGVTNIEAVNAQYKKAGFTRPQIVFWNVNGSSTDFPVTMDESGTMMISGFSPSILKAVINGNDFSTEAILRRAIDDIRYDPVRKALGHSVEPDYEVL